MSNQIVTRTSEDGDDPFMQAARDYKAGIVGRTLVKHYPWVNWLVDIKMDKDGGLAYIRVPEISTKYGMIVMLTEVQPALEYETRKAGGELLERFNVSRGENAGRDIIQLRRGADGEAIGAQKGEI